MGIAIFTAHLKAKSGDSARLPPHIGYATNVHAQAAAQRTQHGTAEGTFWARLARAQSKFDGI